MQRSARCPRGRQHPLSTGAGRQGARSGRRGGPSIAAGRDLPGDGSVSAPAVAVRSTALVRLGLLDAGGKVLHDAALEIDIFPPPAKRELRRIYVLGRADGKAARLAGELGVAAVAAGTIGPDDTVLIDDAKEAGRRKDETGRGRAARRRAVFLDLPAGSHTIASDARRRAAGNAVGAFCFPRHGPSLRRRLSAERFQVLVRCPNGLSGAR